MEYDSGRGWIVFSGILMVIIVMITTGAVGILRTQQQQCTPVEVMEGGVAHHGRVHHKRYTRYA